MKLMRLSFLLIILASCNNSKEQMGSVHHYGALRNLMDGDLNAIVQLDSLYCKAVFTHHSTNMYMHFKTDDGKLAGYLDELQVGNSMKLKFPNRDN